VRVRVRLPLRLPHSRLPFVKVMRSDDATLAPMLLGSLAMFGIGGLAGAALDVSALGQLMFAIAFAAFGASFALVVFGVFHRAQGREPTALRELVGRRGDVMVSIAAGRRGAVRLTYDGAVHVLPAIADSTLSRGQHVEVIAIHGMAVTVRSLPPP
jgi:membrane protein implicated in regulation of membrane protease activity